MKSIFPEYYDLGDQDLRTLFEVGLIALDANALIDLLRYSEDTCEKWFEVLEAYGPRVWIPHQAALEYHRSFWGELLRGVTAYESLISEIEKFKRSLADRAAADRHPHLDAESLATVNEGLEAACANLRERQSQLEAELEECRLRDRIAELLDGKVGERFSRDRVAEIEKDGARRFERRIPPGYADSDKSGDRKFGDLIIWFQMIEKANEDGSPIVFVTRDQKEDWFQLEPRGRTIGPRPELRREFLDETGQLFYAYSPSRFLAHSADRLPTDVEEGVLDEVRSVERSSIRDLADAIARIAANEARLQEIAESYRASMSPIEEAFLETDSSLARLRERLREIQAMGRGATGGLSSIGLGFTYPRPELLDLPEIGLLGPLPDEGDEETEPPDIADGDGADEPSAE